MTAVDIKNRRPLTPEEAEERIIERSASRVTAKFEAHLGMPLSDVQRKMTNVVSRQEFEEAFREFKESTLEPSNRAHGWRGALFGAFGGAGIALFVIWIMLGGLTQSAAFMVKMGVYERQQDQLNQELSEKAHGE